MTYLTADTIVKSVLLRKGYPMHWYLQCLKYCSDAIRELHFRSLKVINTVVITANAGGAITLPADYTAWVRVGLMKGQYVVPLVQGKGTFNRKPNLSGATVIPYGDASSGSWLNSWLNVYTNNEWGENTGRVFGYGAGIEYDLFEEIAERGVIQLSEGMAGMDIVLDYVGNASSPTNLTLVPAMAQACIEQYIIWQLKEHSRLSGKGESKDEERMYWHEERHLRARLNPLTKEDILRISRRSYHGAIKN